VPHSWYCEPAALAWTIVPSIHKAAPAERNQDCHMTG
jgi:hypothetical protein